MGIEKKPTKFQRMIGEVIKQGKSVLLIAPTGLGKTFAVTGDIQDHFCKIVYAVPLRALGYSIRQAVLELNRKGKPIQCVIHHGDTKESLLFSEEVIVTTYDQVVCGVPGLPLSLPLKAGHAVAGAILMSRLILDEVHLAWGISEEAVTVLMGIVEFRKKLGLQTGLDISAPLVISDPAPVDTLVQRAGRCARWFWTSKSEGQFYVVTVPRTVLKTWAHPYREQYVAATIKTMPGNKKLSWEVERQWINEAWGIQDRQGKLTKKPSEERQKLIEEMLMRTTFTLNLFDRAAQEHRPGEIASVFREILSAEVAIEDIVSNRNLQALLDSAKDQWSLSQDISVHP